jgi:hypothetical protein
MNFRSSLQVMLISGVGLLTLGLLASCGANTSSSSQTTATPPASATSQTTTSQPSGAAAEVRLGCGTYCQSAGQYGAPGVPNEIEVINVVGGAVSLEPDGYVPVTITCLVPVTCRGALQLDIEGYVRPESYTTILFPGRSDLAVNANSTQTIGVPLTDGGLAYARANSPVTVKVRGDADLTRCEDDPQLAARCAQIVAADPRHLGNGLQTLFGGKLQLSAT